MDSQIEIDEKTVFSNFRRFAQKPLRLFGQLVHHSEQLTEYHHQKRFYLFFLLNKTIFLKKPIDQMVHSKALYRIFLQA